LNIRAPALGRFGPDHRIRKRAEYRCILAIGARVTTPHFVFVLALRPPDAACHVARLGLVVTKKVGCAVVRNRYKRLAREAFRSWGQGLPGDAEVVVIARPPRAELSLTDVLGEWDKARARVQTSLEKLRQRARSQVPLAKRP